MDSSRFNEDALRERIAVLKGSVTEQAKELALPMGIDLASGLAGWWIGRQMGRSSLLVGLGAYTAGKFHSLHETISREEQRMGTFDQQNKPAMSGFNPLYKSEDRIYHGESPLVSLGFGMMFGGAFSDTSAVNGLSGENMSGPEKVKTVISEIGSDLYHRAYLDKIFGEKKANENADPNKGVSGLNELDVFMAGDKSEFAKLSEFETEVEKSAEDFSTRKSAPAHEVNSPTVEGTAQFSEDEEEDFEGFSSRII